MYCTRNVCYNEVFHCYVDCTGYINNNAEYGALSCSIMTYHSLSKIVGWMWYCDSAGYYLEVGYGQQISKNERCPDSLTEVGEVTHCLCSDIYSELKHHSSFLCACGLTFWLILLSPDCYMLHFQDTC